MKNLKTLLFAMAIYSLPELALAQSDAAVGTNMMNTGSTSMMGGMFGTMMGGSWGFMMLNMWLIYILVVVTLVLLIVWLVKQIKK